MSGFCDATEGFLKSVQAAGISDLTSVRQNENELQAVGHAYLSEDLQRLSFEGVMGTSDGHSFREVLMMGSVWWFPLIKSITVS
jgi:hypothetical protein